MAKRIDQFLFKNIIKQSYEAYKAEQDWFSIYKEQSENEKKLYKFFYSKTLETMDENNNEDENNTKILDYWHSVIENKEDYERWERLYKEKIRRDRMFADVESFLMMFSHHR